jgi:hypothetical protein
MKIKQLLTIGLLATTIGSAAQETYYDITPYYLQNAQFDKHYDYDAAATGNIVNVVHSIDSWTMSAASKKSLTVGATFQYGTPATFYGVPIPATGFDGTANGGCLTLCAALKNELAFYQDVMMPAGKYKLVVAYYNCNPDSEAGNSRTGWIAANSVVSTLESFKSGVWLTDTVSFELTEPTSGQLQVGLKSSSGLTNKSAMLAIDFVKLLRDTPYGEIDDIVPAPEVETDMRFARGATMAFGRVKKAKGDGIKAQGFCFAEHDNPTIADNVTTETLTNKGTIHVLSGLKPTTRYYMRAYAVNKYNKVGYGEVIKFYTIAKGNITYWYNNGGDAAANERVNNAAKEACRIFNELAAARKHFNIGYSSGTPTADCYYADEPWMNMGANSSYQRTGTIMHEMEHGLGLVPYSTQWNGNILRSGLDGNGRGTGQWLGDRVSAFLDFWDNTTGSRLNGDYQHMWPYGINGASEDNGKLELYYANALICQALGEDGLEHNYSTFAEPCYIFNHEDNVKYYIKSESVERGRYSSYLIPTASGTLQWRQMSADEAAKNDSTAWYITFTPANQYYQLRNVATGRYMSYSNGVRTAVKSTLTSNEDFHLMKGRVDVPAGETPLRGYWIIHPEDNWTPHCLQANVNGATGNAVFNIANDAENQRWLILTADEMKEFENVSIAFLKQQTNSLLEQVKQLADVPHTEKAADTDNAFNAALANISKQVEEAVSITNVTQLNQQLEELALWFLSNVKALSADNPFDLTYMVTNPEVKSLDGWTGAPTLNSSCAEFYQKTFNFYQTVSNLPAGQYIVKVQAFQRPGTSADAYADYLAGNDKVTANLYAANEMVKVAHIARDAQTTSLGNGEATVGSPAKRIPNTMTGASNFFAKGLYDNSVEGTVEENGGQLRIGLRSSSMPDNYWVCFANFRLFFIGSDAEGMPSAIQNMEQLDTARQHTVYGLDGRVVAKGSEALSHLRPGIYIVAGKKVVVK